MYTLIVTAKSMLMELTVRLNICPQTSSSSQISGTGVDWRHKLETQRGAVLATELKNNANKLAKWTAAALVSGVEIIKLGYVSRAHQRDTRHHVILGTQVSTAMSCACISSSYHMLPPPLPLHLVLSPPPPTPPPPAAVAREVSLW